MKDQEQKFKMSQYVRQFELRVRFDYGTGVTRVNVQDILPKEDY